MNKNEKEKNSSKHFKMPVQRRAIVSMIINWMSNAQKTQPIAGRKC